MAKMTTAYRTSALRRGIIICNHRGRSTPEHLRQAAALEMANLGFLVLPSALSQMTLQDLTQMLESARMVVGADRNMTPIYPGFPKQVEELDTLTLLVEQLIHYWSFGLLRPDYPDVVRKGLPLEDMLRTARKTTVLDGRRAASALIGELMAAPVAMSEDDRGLLDQSLTLATLTLGQITDLSHRTRNGENLQHLVRGIRDTQVYGSEELLRAVLPGCSHIDQLLRTVLTLATEPSDSRWDSNYTLAVDNLADRHSRAVRMGRLSKASRRMIVHRLGELTQEFRADGLVARTDLWRTVLRAVHPYDFKLSDSSRRGADIVHGNVPYRTLNSLVEEAMIQADVVGAVELLADHQPGNLLRRIVALLRLTTSDPQAVYLARRVQQVAQQATLLTLISAYNGVISANDDRARVTRVAGLNNTMVDRSQTAKVDDYHLTLVGDALKDAIGQVLKSKDAPDGPVGITSEVAVPLVRRDAATSDRTLDRGQELIPVGEGDVLRLFGHWNNNQNRPGYMDIGCVILDQDFSTLAVSTWDSWMNNREWSTYSGDCLVHPGHDAAEYIDVNLAQLTRKFTQAQWAVMTVQSWSGWPTSEVDFIAGAMLRSDAQKGNVFDPRTVATAFKPTTLSTQSVPFAVDLKSGKMIWIDSSNGSTAHAVSSSHDESIGSIVYDEVARPRLTLGQLAQLWADAHGAETLDCSVDRSQILALLA